MDKLFPRALRRSPQKQAGLLESVRRKRSAKVRLSQLLSIGLLSASLATLGCGSQAPDATVLASPSPRPVATATPAKAQIPKNVAQEEPSSDTMSNEMEDSLKRRQEEKEARGPRRYPKRKRRPEEDSQGKKRLPPRVDPGEYDTGSYARPLYGLPPGERRAERLDGSKKTRKSSKGVLDSY